MKTVVAHPSLNSAGGGELVCLSFICLLQKAGYQVCLVTVDRTDWNRLKRIFGGIATPNEERYLLPAFPKMYFLLMSSLLTLAFFVTELLLANIVKGNSLLISTCGEKINSLADLTYINGIPLRCTPILSNVSAKRKCYGRTYDICLRLIDRIRPSVII